MIAPRNHIKVFVASTVYNFQYQLHKIYELLDENYGYDVLNSHNGTISLDSQESNLTNCLNGVKECDIFLGFIRPDYGSGVLDNKGKSIVHQEFDVAVTRKIPRFILADYRVVFTRSLFKGSYIIEEMNNKRIDFDNILFVNTKVIDTRCVRMYNDAIQDKRKPESERTGNWVQEYIDLDDIRLHIESQFKYPERITKLIEKSKK